MCRGVLAWFVLHLRAGAEVTGFALVTAGLHQVYEPAAFVFAGAALIFLAQGMEA